MLHFNDTRWYLTTSIGETTSRAVATASLRPGLCYLAFSRPMRFSTRRTPDTWPATDEARRISNGVSISPCRYTTWCNVCTSSEFGACSSGYCASRAFTSTVIRASRASGAARDAQAAAALPSSSAPARPRIRGALMGAMPSVLPSALQSELRARVGVQLVHDATDVILHRTLRKK